MKVFLPFGGVRHTSRHERLVLVDRCPVRFGRVRPAENRKRGVSKHGRHRHILPQMLANPIPLRGCDGRATTGHLAPFFRRSDASAGALGNQVALKLGEAADHMEEELPVGAGGIEVFRQRPQFDVPVGNLFRHANHFAKVAPEPIQFPDNQPPPNTPPSSRD